MGISAMISQSHKFVEERVREGDIVIDATVGNGHDTLFLAGLVGTAGAVYGFDIQEQALANARERIDHQLGASRFDIHLLRRSHADMLQAIPEKLHGQTAAIMFNLGYLPGAGHGMVTRPESTVPALNAS